MNAILPAGIIAMCFAAGPATGGAEKHENLIEPLRAYVSEIVGELDKVAQDRRETLDYVAAQIATRLRHGKAANLTFICSHNSRRSHMSQLWSQTAAYYYGLDGVHAFSGGTEATACNTRTVAALRRVGFSVVRTTQGENPRYLIQFSDDRPPVLAYSKLYHADGNPQEGYIALMCCSKADKSCPVVQGAACRYAIHYVDPKECDDTPLETSTYNARCREIAREMFYIMSQVRKRLGDV